MKCYKFLFLLILLSSITIKYAYAMDGLESQVITEKKVEIVVINNRLLTTIIGVIAITDTSFLQGRRIGNLKLKKDTLVNLIGYEEKISSYSKGPGTVELFCPVVFKKTDDSLQNLGPLNKKKHRELIEAIRENKALYYPYKQGAFVYALDVQPKPEICQRLNAEIEKEEKKEIVLQALL